MKKYTATEIVNKALSLADLSNTDFMSHNELTEALNDAWKELTQIFINNGDKIFVKETFLQTGGFSEYAIPNDCYQILSLKDSVSGNIIKRYTEGMSKNSGHYEVVNNKIRLYGVTSSNLLLTYWVVPEYITFPEKDQPVKLPNTNVIDTCKNSVLVVDGDNVIVFNTKTGEEIGRMGYDESFHYKLGNGHIFVYNDELWVYKDFYGNDIYGEEGPIASTLKDYNGFVYYTINDECYLINTKQKQNGEGLVAIMKDFDVYLIDDVYYLNDRNGNSIEVDLGSIEYVGDNYIIYINDGLKQLIVGDTIENNDLEIFTPIYLGTVENWAITSNGTDVVKKSTIQDWELNFPNNIYFTLLSANIAKRIVSKQNAENAGLNEIYQNAYQLYIDSLDMNSGYPRIINVC